jgi:DNA-binding NarL/FixJ family response regulator
LLGQLGRKAPDEKEKFAEPSPEPPGKRKEPLLLEPFTPREIEVLRLLTQGQTNQEIAQNLLVSVSTVKLNIRGLINKLGVSDRVQAAVHAVELGILPPERQRTY